MNIEESIYYVNKMKFQALWDFDMPFVIVESHEVYYYANNLCAANSCNP